MTHVSGRRLLSAVGHTTSQLVRPRPVIARAPPHRPFKVNRAGLCLFCCHCRRCRAVQWLGKLATEKTPSRRTNGQPWLDGQICWLHVASVALSRRGKKRSGVGGRDGGDCGGLQTEAGMSAATVYDVRTPCQEDDVIINSVTEPEGRQWLLMWRRSCHDGCVFPMINGRLFGCDRRNTASVGSSPSH